MFLIFFIYGLSFMLEIVAWVIGTVLIGGLFKWIIRLFRRW